ncbi:hypothetical protein F4V57_10110 [Acinetobacter qingfengensis]|nr:hypothetical protein [Acinetobacter qingfengensis]KAA8732477.1 hypothetical protein F4V57_10110 [Acinetobacter qingfengensis]
MMVTPGTSVFAASFNCNQAQSITEKQICAVRSLNDADVKLATTYQLILKAVPMGSRDAQKDRQWQWLKQRNRCGKTIQCLQAQYQNRQHELDTVIEQRILSQGPF